MSIKTHYRLRVNGETDNAKLTPRTSYGPETKLYFPCNEGAGTTVTDFGAQAFVCDNADVNVTVGNGTASNTMNIMQWNGAGAGQAANTGSVAAISPAGLSFCMFIGVDVLSSAALAGMGLGGTGAGWAKVFGTTTSITDGTTTTSATAGFQSAVGVAEFVAIVFDRENALMSVYRYADGTQGTTVTATISGAMGDITFSDLIQISNGAAQDVYGCGFHVFANGVPSTIAADIAELHTNVMGSSKVLPVNWMCRT